MITDDQAIEYLEAGELMDTKLTQEQQLRLILKVLRVILRCADEESLVARAMTVIRRADRLATTHPEFGPI